MGRCEYVLAKDSVNNTFEVRQTNEPCGNGDPSCTKSLTVIFPSVTIQLFRGSVVVNGTKVILPARYQGKLNLCLCYKSVHSRIIDKLHENKIITVKKKYYHHTYIENIQNPYKIFLLASFNFCKVARFLTF